MFELATLLESILGHKLFGTVGVVAIEVNEPIGGVIVVVGSFDDETTMVELGTEEVVDAEVIPALEVEAAVLDKPAGVLVPVLDVATEACAVLAKVG